MPYIIPEKRAYLDSHIDNIYHAIVDLEMDALGEPDTNNTEGNLNYIFTRLLLLVYGDKDETRYANINDVMGLLECVKAEFYRKVAAPYEDQKEFDNGAVVGKQVHVEDEVIIEITEDERQETLAKQERFRALHANDEDAAAFGLKE